MSEFFVQNRTFLVILGLVFLLLFLLFRKRSDIRGCLLVSFVICFVAAFLFFQLDVKKWYQCRFSAPDHIWIAGHIKDPDNQWPNNYLVILYRGSEEISRNISRPGKFQIDAQDQERDGYFELAPVVNELQFTRCSLLENFQQDSSGHNFPWLKGKSVYLWRNFADLEAGRPYLLNKNEDPQKQYTLIALPGSLGGYPREITSSATYLDQYGEVAVNAPIKTYTMVGSSAVENITGYYTHASRLPDAPQPVAIPAGASKVLDAWVAEGSTVDALGLEIPDENMIDGDNCAGSSPLNTSIRRSRMYIHEVQFQGDATPNLDLATAALEASPSLGFTQGQMDTGVATVDLAVPAGQHKKYQIIWQEQLRTGKLSIQLEQAIVQVPFRARIGIGSRIVSFDVDCPSSQ